MKKLFRLKSALIAAASLLLGSCADSVEQQQPAQPLQPSYLAMEVSTGRVLYASEANQRRPIGMLANLATAAIVLDWVQGQNISLNQMITAPPAVLENPHTNLLGLVPGARISIRDALYSALLWDDSSAATALAYACGSVLNPSDPLDAFTTQMNRLARQTLQMKTTYFKGPSGAHVSYSTAKDMARLSIYALDNTTLRTICSQRSADVSIHMPDGSVQHRTVLNTNRMLSTGESVDGLKAARSASAGSCLIATARRASVKLINPQTGKQATYAQRLLVVILGMPSPTQRYQLAARFMRDGWQEWRNWQATSDTSEPNKFIKLSTQTTPEPNTPAQHASSQNEPAPHAAGHHTSFTPIY